MTNPLILEGTTVSVWLALVVIGLALLVGWGLGFATGAVFGRREGVRPWWFSSPDETTPGAMKALADRFALGEIDAAEFQERVDALRTVSEPPELRKRRLEHEAGGRTRASAG